MAWDLSNKVVVVTGGAEGIGYDIADKFLQKGAKLIIILDINEKLGIDATRKLTEKHGNTRAVFIKCDMTTDIEAVSMQVFKLGTVDILVNSAGMINDMLAKKTIDINLTALIECSFKFWEHMRKDKGGNGGTIINLASIYGIITDQFFPVYQASKFAVMAFTKSLGHIANFNRSGVRVVALCPGFTETSLTKEFIMWDPTQNDNFKEYLKQFTWQKADDVGNAAVEVYQRANSGSAWRIEGGEPLTEVPEST